MQFMYLKNGWRELSLLGLHRQSSDRLANLEKTMRG